jgi:hypothetical protein
MSKVIINDVAAFLNHLSFWHNKTDDECTELAKDENGNLDAEQALMNMLERDFCTSINNNVVEELKNLSEK